MPSTSPYSPSQDGQTVTTAVGAIVIGLAVVSCILRFYVRISTKRSSGGLKIDDWTILVATIILIIEAVLLVWGARASRDQPVFSAEPDGQPSSTPETESKIKALFAGSVIYFPLSGITKHGILMMYNRIFEISKMFRYQLWIASGLVFSWWVGCMVAALCSCIPLKYAWDGNVGESQYCFNYSRFWMISGACEIVLDVLILTMPISMVMRMHMRLRETITVIGVFLLGGFVVATGLVRVILGYLGYSSAGNTRSFSDAKIWTSVHSGMSIVCACLPILKPLLKFLGKSSVINGFSRLVSRGGSRPKSGHAQSTSKT